LAIWPFRRSTPFGVPASRQTGARSKIVIAYAFKQAHSAADRGDDLFSDLMRTLGR